jgi:MarR family transcriptional regulator, transcriptional regulator for hemolysin
VLAAEGEALSTFLVLDVVAREEGRSQREIADGVRIEGATMTRHLDRLEAEGFVARRPDPEDRRATLVDLTSAGRRTHRRLRAIMSAAHDACWTGIRDRDRETTRRVAMRLSQNVEALAGPQRMSAIRGGTSGDAREQVERTIIREGTRRG